MLCTPRYHSFFIGGFMRSIDLVSFLCNYYGIVSKNLKINKLTHNDMKVLFPDIKRSSFDNLEHNSSLIYKGEIILVHDCNGYILPYINPHIKVDECFEDISNYEEQEIIDISELDLDKLSKEELLKLRKKLKKNHQYHDEHNVTNKIRNKKNPKVKQYKRNKIMIRMEEFE